MLTAISLLLTTLLSESTEPWDLAWPMFDESSQSEFCHIGFGDWCVSTEGPHPGIDFKAPVSGAIVLSPANETTWVYYVLYDDTKGGTMIIDNIQYATSSSEISGWSIGHLDNGVFAYIPGTEISPKSILTGVFDKEGDWFPHIHLSWWGINGFWDNVINPFLYLTTPSGYDELVFRRIPYIEDDLSTSRGIYFFPQNTRSLSHSILEVNDFQNVVYGLVDFAIAPASEDCLAPYSDSLAGVRELMVDILDMSGNATAYSARKVFDFYNTNIPTINSHADEYDAMFFDSEYTGAMNSRVMWHFNTTYIGSNSGCMTSGFETCYDNIWTDEQQVHNWGNGEFNLGCWDTRLGIDEAHHPAEVNAYAAFPDDRYVVNITATSHGGITGSRLLPAEDIEQPESPENVRGVIVDNYRPYVDSVIVYTVTGSDEIKLLYTAGWDEDVENGTAELNVNPDVLDYLPLVTPRPTQLWIAVKYSEPMTTGSGDVWLMAEMREQVEWRSPSGGVFMTESTQTNWPQSFGPLEDSRLSGGMWQLYRYVGVLPNEYNGRLTLHIAHDDEHPVDYDGNSIDGDPSTIADPRNADGSWSGEGYEAEDDASYEWGTCEWEVSGSGTSDGYFYAMVGDTRVQTVYFTEIALGKAETDDEYVHVVNANIPYNCGAFVSLVHYVSDRIWNHEIRVIDGDGNWVGQTVLWGPRDKSGNIVYAQWDFFKPGIENETFENKYYWIRHRYVFYHSSQARYESREEWWGYNGHTGMWCGEPADPVVRSDLYFNDYCPAWSSSRVRQWFYINYNEPEPPEYVIENGWYIPVYYVQLGNPNPYYRGEMFAPTQVQTNNPSIIEESEMRASDSPEVYTFDFLPIMPNPASSSVTVRYSVEDAGNYEIEVYDLCGRVHAELLHGEVSAGIHSFTWNLSDDAGENLPAGIYLVRLAGCNEEEIQRLVVLE